MISKVDKVFLDLLFIVTLSSGWWHLNKTDVSYTKESIVEAEKLEPEEVAPESVKPVLNIPDFANIYDVQEKKDTFFAFIKELVDAENQLLAETRNWLLSTKEKSTLTADEGQQLMVLINYYKVDEKMSAREQLDELLLKVDEIPVSLALVQAANESAWGTSRFALDAHNYFGQWCFSSGCGIVPERRPEGARYEVRKFDSPAHSVRSYMHNLNSSHHYEGLREMRMEQRELGKPVTGLILAQGLHAYSIRGVDYVNELVKMIEGNDLLRYDLEQEPKQ